VQQGNDTSYKVTAQKQDFIQETMYKQGNDTPAEDKTAKVETVETTLKIKGRSAPHQSIAFIADRFRVNQIINH
jgi:hypothetical protein